MTAICGIVSLNGSEISQTHSELMLHALAHHGPGRVSFLQADCSNPTSAQPTIVGVSRLDNRSDLLQLVGIAPHDQEKFGDNSLILAAYQKMGERCVELLLGDFAFAIWDPQRAKLFCARDHMGRQPLFYYHSAQQFVFASEPKAICAIAPETCRINRDKLATLAFPEFRRYFWNQSWFEKISALGAGSSLSLDQNGLRDSTYWEPKPSSDLPVKDEDLLEALQQLLSDVVVGRLAKDGENVALLSGGLDSSTIVSLAARALARDNKQLHALAAVLPDEERTTLTDEREFIDCFRDWPNLTINYITAEDRGPFDALEEMVWTCDSPLLTSRHFLYSAFAERGRQLGAGVILDGAGGELGPSFHGEGYYAELLLRCRWHTLIRELNFRQQRTGVPVRRSFRVDVLNPLLPVSLLDGLRPRPAEDYEFERLQPIQRQFAEEQLGKLMSHKDRTSRRSTHILPNHRKVQLDRQRQVQKKSTYVGGFLGYGQIEMRYPFMDKRLLEFCLAVPGRLKINDGYKRYLLRRVMDRALPPAIQWRTSKHPFSPDYFRRYNSQRSKAQKLLADISPTDPVRQVVDVEKLKQLALIPVTDQDVFSRSVALHAVPDGIYLICFLRRFAEFRM